MPRDIKILDRQCYASDITVIEQGSEGNRAYIIESGKVEVFLRDIEGKDVQISTLGAGALIGEIGLLNDSKRVASVKTVEPTVLVSISSYDFKDAMAKSTEFRESVMNKAKRRIKEVIGVIDEQTQPDKILKSTDKTEILMIRHMLERSLDTINKKAKKEINYPK